ncbi:MULTISPECIES: FtsB family cell division protein [Methylosinus]|uniref:Septation inhibitor protein n=1 Tax=Methylosinus sporium TaxID=428 RepID=A0A2U1SP58_METSR|nr:MULTISPECIES: septum formation initiator family protein [Methylosinus]MBU3889229.1 septum formation initiator family protein [Methylosinus sp. KRF6]PWB93390.1 septation inhibitor protein [Methylosinus sporium]TRL36642.1 septum formation initiator family protein [Methylosinus sporium]
MFAQSGGMFARHVLRSFVIPLLLYGAAGLVASYFVWHGVNGQRGLKAGVEYEQRIAELRGELAGLKAERAQWERKLALVRGDVVDADILDEEARLVLGRAHRNDIVILTPPAPSTRR